MNHRQTAEVAALASAYAPHLIEGTAPLPNASLLGYWNHTRRRLNHWLRRLQEYRAARCQTEGAIAAGWRCVEPVLEELFVAEILIRVWSAILTASGEPRSEGHGPAVGRSVHLGQLKARQIAMELLLNARPPAQSAAARIDRLRRRTERWTDVLLGHLVLRYPVAEFAFVEDRAREFGRQQLRGDHQRQRNEVWEFILAGLRLSFPATPHTLHDAAVDERDVVEAVLSTFPADAFHQDGPLKGVLHLRVARSGMQPERPPAASIATPPPSAPQPTEPLQDPATPSRIRFAELRRRFRKSD